MNAPTTTAVEKMPSPMEAVVSGLARMEAQLKTALPAHMPVERFTRVVLTAIQLSPRLLQAERNSLFLACMKCAQDGLLPDGRDAALVPFIDNKMSQDQNRTVWQVQYMPMIAGILKKIRNSGELKSISAHVVYEHDKFAYRLGDEEMIVHEPLLDGERGKPRFAYCVAHTKDGGIYREVMTMDDIGKVRSMSKAKKSGPWFDWWEEMAKKTVMRRCAKRLPQSTDLDDLLRRDDDLYELGKPDGDGPGSSATLGRPETVAGALELFAGGETVLDHDPQTGEVREGSKPGPKPAAPSGPDPAAAKQQAAVAQAEAEGEVDLASDEWAEDTKPAAEEASDAEDTPAVPFPTDEASYQVYALWHVGLAKDSEKLKEWFIGEEQKKLRAACKVGKGVFTTLQTAAKKKIAELKPAK